MSSKKSGNCSKPTKLLIRKARLEKSERRKILGFYGKKMTLNDSDRAQWIDNDEGLYNWWRSSHMSKSAFIKENRKELTDLILAYLNKPPRG